MMRVEVTQEHIDDGNRWDCGFCPVARAMLRYYPVGTKAGVDEFSMTLVTPDDDMDYFILPPEAQAFIRAFDAGQPVAPFAFELETGDLG